MQKTWVHTTVPDVNDNSADGGNSALAPIETILPGVSQKFAAVLYSPQDSEDFEPFVHTEPPHYTSDAPQRQDYSTESSLGKPMSFLSCYDLREELFDEHCKAVLKTQLHLLKIGMLTQLPNVELEKVHKAMSQIPSSSLCFDLIDCLLAEINEGKVEVHQGLDTGFTLPDQKGHFWAVSYENESKLLIFISLKTPDLAGMILHAYLAHHGVSRMERFDCELEMFEAISPESTHPRVSAELTTSSYSELMMIVQQLSISSTRHPLLNYV